MAETSPHGIDRRRRGPAGGWWRGTSQWRTFCSTCSPAVGGRQYRVRGDAQVRLRSGLEAPMKLRPLARHRPPNSSLPELDAIFIIPGAAKRHKATGGSKVTQGSIGFERSHRYRDREDRPYQPDAPARDAG